ncbi:MAG: serine/threonine protein kinase, partial [Deltaproteobacteria bacterium]|nr:serine/threonine protein kinase [Deltaproteobacteria bacterium]
TEGIWYCLYDRYPGRAPQDLDEAAAERLGMLLGRLHNVGAAAPAPHRLRLGGDSFGREELAWMLGRDLLPGTLRSRYEAAAREIADAADRLMAGVPLHRVHGDFHRGNLLLRDGVFHVLDFDDMVTGPAVQDLWLLVPDREGDGLRLREALLEGYERFRPFPRASLALAEPLRGLRRVRYAAWLARRWHDPVFPQTWPHFGTGDYWDEETRDLEDLVAAIRAGDPEIPRPEPEPPPLTNRDFFFDWEG